MSCCVALTLTITLNLTLTLNPHPHLHLHPLSVTLRCVTLNEHAIHSVWLFLGHVTLRYVTLHCARIWKGSRLVVPGLPHDGAVDRRPSF